VSEIPPVGIIEPPPEGWEEPEPVFEHYVLMRGRFVDLNQGPVPGVVRFRPRARRVVDVAGRKIALSDEIVVPIDPLTGTFRKALLATDDPALTPTSWSYEVLEPGRAQDSYDIQVPYDSPLNEWGQREVWLSDVIQVNPGQGLGQLIIGPAGPRGPMGEIPLVPFVLRGRVQTTSALNSIASPDESDAYLVQDDDDAVHSWTGTAWLRLGVIQGLEP
jgi:hypothetical protein